MSKNKCYRPTSINIQIPHTQSKKKIRVKKENKNILNIKEKKDIKYMVTIIRFYVSNMDSLNSLPSS